MRKIHIIDIQISRKELEAMTPKEQETFIETIIDAMTKEQKIQMALIGALVVDDDIMQRATKRSRTALRTLARAVNVTVNEAKE